MENRTDRICYGPSTIAQDGDQEYLIYFITGNPCVIGYYDSFMSRLATILNAGSVSERYYVCGYSLPGFDLLEREILVDKELPCGLEEQIQSTEILIEKSVIDHNERSDTIKRSPKVILMGHSIGCYIMLEILRRRKMDINAISGFEDIVLSNVNIGGGVLLFPTIAHMNKSRNGRILTVSIDI
jgi:Lipid-droplet associated hydrolase